MSVSLALFYLYALIAVAGAVGLIAARELIHAVMSMFATLFAIAALYMLMGNEFIAAMQLFVYGGAITVLVLFVLMLTRPSDALPGTGRMSMQLIAGAISLVFFGILAFTLGRAEWQVTAMSIQDTASLAEILFSRYVLPFEVAGLVLTIALIGAIVLSREDDMLELDEGGGDE